VADRVSAGDIDRFVYCPLNWKRAKEGQKGLGGGAGQRVHDERSEAVDEVGAFQREARFSLETSFLLALVAISGATLAIEITVLETGTIIDWILVFLAVMWLGGSLYLLAFNLYFSGRAAALGGKARLVRGDVSYVDTTGKRRPKAMVSRTLPLTGRPDYVVEADGAWIPVEVKSGRTPRRPYDSHVLQLAAYCHLVEHAHGVRPPHGVLEYPDARFEVPYTPELETELVRTLLRMELAERTGEAHRDHQSKGRCAGCARREGCPERLDVPAASMPEGADSAAAAGTAR
jgi:CRISPR-associated exonuclease Cas4